MRGIIMQVFLQIIAICLCKLTGLAGQFWQKESALRLMPDNIIFLINGAALGVNGLTTSRSTQKRPLKLIHS